MVAFLVVENPDGTYWVSGGTMGVHTRASAARKQAQALAQDVRRCALVQRGVASFDGRTAEAVFVEGSQRGCPKSVIFARMYQGPKGDRPGTYVGEPRLVACARSLFERRRRRWPWWLAGTAALFGVAFAFLVFNNNSSLSQMPAREFRAKLHRAISKGTGWLAARTDTIALDQPNPALLYMIRDMADLSGEPSLRQIVAAHLHGFPNYCGRCMVEEKAPFIGPSAAQLTRMDDYQRWFLHACAPAEFALKEEDRASMLSPTMHRRGSLTHQLFALTILRQRGLSHEKVDGLIDTLSERIATEAAWDFRVTDLYLQRVAFLLAAGRHDLVKARWVERILAWQQENGGWKASWYSFWGPGVSAFRLGPQAPNAHTTVQGVWLLYMLKYRCPEWIKANYE